MQAVLERLLEEPSLTEWQRAAITKTKQQEERISRIEALMQGSPSVHPVESLKDAQQRLHFASAQIFAASVYLAANYKEDSRVMNRWTPLLDAQAFKARELAFMIRTAGKGGEDDR